MLGRPELCSGGQNFARDAGTLLGRRGHAIQPASLPCQPSVLVGLQPPLPGRAGPGWPKGMRQRCAGRVADSDSHCRRQFKRDGRRPQRPRPSHHPMRRLRVHTLWSPQTSRCDQGDPSRETRRSCACRVARGCRGSLRASPPSLGRAWIHPDSPTSKSTHRDPESEYPVVVFKIERT